MSATSAGSKRKEPQVSTWPKEFEEVLRGFRGFANPEAEIDPDVPFVALGVDSLTMLSPIVEGEEALGTILSPESLTKESLLTSPGSLWQVLTAQPADATPLAHKPEAGR